MTDSTVIAVLPSATPYWGAGPTKRNRTIFGAIPPTGGHYHRERGQVGRQAGRHLAINDRSHQTLFCLRQWVDFKPYQIVTLNCGSIYSLSVGFILKAS